MMYFPSKEEVDRLRQRYPAGTRIECLFMNDPYSPITAGEFGTVIGVDDAGDLLMRWDSGRSLKLIPGEDSFRVTKTSE